MKIKAGVIGLGRIGSQWDHGELRDPPLTHVGAILQDEKFQLCAVCDNDTGNRERFAREWKLDIPIYSSPSAMLEREKLDVICVATPASSHYSIMKEAIASEPNTIFCEKPYCSNASEAQEICRLMKIHGVAVSVNYHRRWDERINALKTQMDSMPPPSHVEVVYGKGLLNYGSHIVNLLLLLFGPVSNVVSFPLSLHQKQMDDPSVSSMLTFESGLQVALRGLDDVHYDLFDMDIYYPEMKVRLESGGYLFEVYEAVKDSRIKGYTHLRGNREKSSAGPVHGLKGAYKEIHDSVLNGISCRVSTAEAALQTLKILDAMRASSLNEKPIEL